MFTSDRNELEAAQKFLEQAAIENLVRILLLFNIDYTESAYAGHIELWRQKWDEYAVNTRHLYRRPLPSANTSTLWQLASHAPRLSE